MKNIINKASLPTKNDFKQIKFTKESLNKPTPKKWRKIGNSLLTLGSTVSGIAGVITLNPIVAAVGLGLSGIGKVITIFASE